MKRKHQKDLLESFRNSEVIMQVLEVLAKEYGDETPNIIVNLYSEMNRILNG